jgi:AraC family L-rhamnose operon regulatory protein RhaS
METCELLDKGNPLEAAHLAGTVNHLMLRVAKLLSTDADPSQTDPHGYSRSVRAFFQGLEANRETAAETWTVTGMAHACRVGVTYLNAACRELFNTTPGDYLVRIRLGHARRRLREQHEQSVTEIAFECGFNSSQHFATCFRRHYGETPTAFRQKGAS